MGQLKLLIIEGNDDQRRAIVRALESHFGRGTVLACGTLEEALQQPLPAFDLILSDYYLPDANGMEMLRRVRNVCSTPIVIVTGEYYVKTANRAIRSGATDYVVKANDFAQALPLVVEKNLTVARIKRENETLHHQLERALGDISRKNAELEHSLHRMEELAATDALTGLYNRRHFARVSGQMFAEAYRCSTDLACIMIDLDGFKQVNDRLGHQAGDSVLVLASRVILAGLRKMDVAARFGGDEFIILLPQTGIEAARIVAQRIHDEFNHAVAMQIKEQVKVSMSIGIETFKQLDAQNEEQLFAAADAAMYRAKKDGRDRVCCGGDVLHSVFSDAARSGLHV